MRSMRPSAIALLLTLAGALPTALTIGCWSSQPPDPAGDAASADTRAADTDSSETDSSEPGPSDAATDTDTADVSGDASASPDGSSDSGSDTGPVLRPLISNAAWTRLERSEDPLADHRPKPVACPDTATTLEPLNGTTTFTVDTSRCNYLAVHQSLLSDLEAGDRLRMRLWHFQLAAAEPAEAHAALLVDGEVVWEETVAIPAESQLFRPEWQAEQTYTAGTDVTFHLHNHGANTWNFIEFVELGE